MWRSTWPPATDTREPSLLPTSRRRGAGGTAGAGSRLPGAGSMSRSSFGLRDARVDPQRATGLLTLAAGLALAEAVEAATGLRADIKWPNDLLVGRRKLAGILAESASSDLGRIVLGYGLNVSARAYPPELGDRATSLETELGRPIDRAVVCAETLAAVSARYRDLLAGRFDAILDGWRSRAPASRGARVTWSTPAGPQHGRDGGDRRPRRAAGSCGRSDRDDCRRGSDVDVLNARDKFPRHQSQANRVEHRKVDLGSRPPGWPRYSNFQSSLNLGDSVANVFVLRR